MNKLFQNIKFAGAFLLLFAITSCTLSAQEHWVGTWGTAGQLAESHNNPPSPGLGNNSFRQIVQVSIGGETARLQLTNEFSNASTEILAVELAHAKTAGSSSEIDESTTVSLTFNGKSGVTMAPGTTAVSDPIKFSMGPRQNVAITIHYGTASSTSVSGHPGSRTTSYIAKGNTNDFSNATRTDHWYNIKGIDVLADAEAGAVAILGNSITDGRGSTTNQQNRWADVLSRRLLANEATKNVAVLNMGIGGNCMLAGGLGPTGSSRYRRDLLEQAGVKWIILFEAVNDLGGSRNGMQTANNIIEVYKQIIREAHAKGIYVFGGTITPFKNNGYYSEDHEKGRQRINSWMRTTKMLDGVIEFDHAVRDSQDTICMNKEFLFENDYLHPNAKGYEAMGNIVDLSLFTTDKPLGADEEDDNEGLTGQWIEAESLVTPTCGNGFVKKEDLAASKGSYLYSEKNITSGAPADSADLLVARFNIETAGYYNIYARVQCPTWDDDSYWVKMDNGNFSFANGLQCGNMWEWKSLFAGNLTVGEHTFTIGCRENGAMIDKLFITTSDTPPLGIGGSEEKPDAIAVTKQEAKTVQNAYYNLKGMKIQAPQSGIYIRQTLLADGERKTEKVIIK